jgi:hypothetical protein
MGDRGEKVGERGRISLDSRRMVGLRNGNPGIFWPLSQIRSGFIPDPAASQGPN